MARLGNKDRGLFEKAKGSGVWWVLWYDHRGKRHRKKIGSKSEASAWYQSMKARVHKVKLHPELAEKFFPTKAKALTLAQVIETYRPEMERMKSWSDMKRFAEKWTALIGSLPITEVSKEHAKKRQAARLAKGLAPATINREIAWLKAVLNRALDDGLIEKNPLVRFKKLPENNIHDRFMMDAEEARIEAVMAPEDFEVLAIAADTGLRQGEQFTLAWADVSFEDEGWLSIKEAKGDKRRSVPLTKRAYEILWRRYQTRTCSWVFPNANGKPRSADNFCQRQFRPALKAAGIENLTWHQAGRHTCGSRMALEGVSLQRIAQVLGHSQATISERYSHLLPESARASIMALDNRAGNRHLRAVK